MALTLEQARAKLAAIEIPTIEPVTKPVKKREVEEYFGRRPEVAEEAFGLLKQYELKDWVFRFSNEKRTLGRCFYTKKLITFSNFYLDNDPAEVSDVLKHEVAHALSWVRHGRPGRGHGKLWKVTCLEVGARPIRCNNVATSAATPNYTITCPHGCKWTRYRLVDPQRWLKARCNKHDSFLIIYDHKNDQELNPFFYR